MKAGTTIVWFRNDLRLHDNEVLTKAVKNSEQIIPIYCIDPRHFSITPFGTKKTGDFRAQFLLESLVELRKAIHELGGKLLVEIDLPENIIPALALKYNAKAVYAQKEITEEEIKVENSLEKELWKHVVPLELIWGNTLIHVDDIPFSTKDIPDIFTHFRKRIESESTVRPIQPLPCTIKVPEDLEESPIPNLKELRLTQSKTMLFSGGEQHALDRLNYYCWETDYIKTYKETRNRLIGTNYSTKLSPWLANGCVSARYIYHEIKKYEYERGANDSTYWLVFELLWRDYFKFIFKKYSNKFFNQNGIKSGQVLSYWHL